MKYIRHFLFLHEPQRTLIAAMAGAIMLALPAGAADLTGRASVIDGDTIEIAGQRVRFNGVDAPESWQRCRDGAGKEYRCGKDAAFALDQFLAASRPTTCTEIDRDRYKRIVADCRRADGASLNAWTVESGNAVDWPRYSHGAFQRQQETAKAARRGIWRGAFELPCEARAKRSHREPAC